MFETGASEFIVLDFPSLKGLEFVSDFVLRISDLAFPLFGFRILFPRALIGTSLNALSLDTALCLPPVELDQPADYRRKDSET